MTRLRFASKTLQQILICVYAPIRRHRVVHPSSTFERPSMPRKKQMMIRARIDLSTGEAEINNMAELEELIASDPLLAADALAMCFVT